MGWGSAQGIMEQIIREFNKGNVSPAVKLKIYEILIEAFEDNDADTLEDCRGIDLVYDEAYAGMH